MKVLKRHRDFEKDIKKVQISDKHYTKLILYLGDLIRGKELPPEAFDHQLQGDLKEFREFHVSGDLLVIYQVYEDSILLARIGSHSQLFK